VVSKEGEWFATVQFMDKDGFLSPEYTDSIILDFTPPIGGVMLNDGAATTTNPKVKATYLAFDLITAVNQMCYTAFNEEDPYSWWSLYEPYQGAQMDKFLTFSPKPGKKTVIMHFMDAAGNVTEKTATITLKARALPFLNLLLD
jgi:hypothetical protein